MYRIILLLSIFVFSAASHALTDPTRPSSFQGVSSDGGGDTLVLESILIGEKRRVAVINGSVVTEGEKYELGKVIAIAKDSVKINSGGKLIKLDLYRPSIRQEK